MSRSGAAHTGATRSPTGLGTVQFEVIPLPGIDKEVIAHLPPGARVTITSSPGQGQQATLELARSLADRGYNAVPHLAARAIRDGRELAEILDGLSAAGVSELFVIAGDAEQPAGDFDGSLELLAAIAEHEHHFTIGIGGHPEGHPFLDDQEALRLLEAKAPYASYLVTQMCFEASPLLEWVDGLRQRGIDLPVRPGVAGPVGLARLLRIGARVGVGASLSMLRSQGAGIRRLVTPGTWTPDPLLEDLAAAHSDPALEWDGLHVYTFNAVQESAKWWAARGR